MPDASKPTNHLLWLYLLLALGSAIFAGLALWLLFQGGTGPGLIALAVAAGMAAAALGLYRQKRWGVVIFGLLAMVGSVNHLVNVVGRYPAEVLRQPGAVASAVVSILFAILVPAVLLYLTLLLWRRSR